MAKPDPEATRLAERLLTRAPKGSSLLQMLELVESLKRASKSYHRHAEACCNGDYYRGREGDEGDKAEQAAEKRKVANVDRILAANPWLTKAVRIDYQGDPRAGVGFKTVLLPRNKKDSERVFYV